MDNRPAAARARRRFLSTFGRLGSERTLRHLRLGSGLIMMTFVVMHLGNLSLGLISPEAADAARPSFLAVWRNPVGTTLLYGSIVVHVVLVLRSIYVRRTLVMPAREAAQIIFGLLVPVLLVEHVAGTRIVENVTGVDVDYAFVITALWIETPLQSVRQILGVLAVWAHGCLGLHFWLRFRHGYPAWAPYLLIAAVLLPVLALLGFAEAGKALSARGEPQFPPETSATLIDAALYEKMTIVNATYVGFGTLVAAVFAARYLRRRREWRNTVEIRYEGGELVRIPKGHSVLEASRVGGIPHYSVCGGKGRCSTCRIKVIEGLDHLAPASSVERITLARIGAEPDVRLACQVRPTEPIKVQPLLAVDRERALVASGRNAKPGREQEIVVLFCDIRSFTALSDHRLPFDTVFLLNRYFALVGRAVERAGGQLDKFIGDGAMALFGLAGPRSVACRQALVAAADILKELDGLSDQLQDEIPAPLRVAIGIHVGPAIVGAMGYGGVMNVTAIGDTVNVASRLESAAKEFDAAIVVSEAVVTDSRLDLTSFDHRKIDIRGRTRPLDVLVVPHGAMFSTEAQALLASPA